MPPTRKKSVPARAVLAVRPRSLLKPTPAQRALHALGNALSAAQLRVNVLVRDPTCMWAQKANLEALCQILADAIAETNRLETLAAPKTRPAPVTRHR